MVWAGIIINGRMPLHVFDGGTLNAQQYRILESHVRLFREAVAPPYRAGLVNGIRRHGQIEVAGEVPRPQPHSIQCGRPKRILSDRAPAFTSPKFRRFLIEHGIQPLLTIANNPQANGLCERLNATLTGKLRLLHLENPRTSWTKLIRIVTQKYNDTPHTITGFPPIFLMFNIIPSDLNNHINPNI
ncbi:hypothetical protein LAZ67_4003392 [Cordylochernes scorpioides]|uniref:Integrase catalytic domain-containing protein n=1 Tax=Cordylochernes scorpioides TaxID=51811 RepID=A0ABY6KDL6_9ARAC|nr:hypothetical protein LAZ67_4003392 [Cordylochernes scorpioides]